MNGLIHTQMNAKQLFTAMYKESAKFPLFNDVADWRLMQALIDHDNIIFKHPDLSNAEVDCFSDETSQKVEFDITRILGTSTKCIQEHITVVICDVKFRNTWWAVGVKPILLREFKQLERHLYIDEALETL